MLTFIAIIHLFVCLLLIALVLLQDPKGGGTGGVFGGGGSNTLLGATGAVTFLTRLTRYSAIVFGVTCLILTLLSRPEQGSVLDKAPSTGGIPPAGLPSQPQAPQPPKSAADAAPANQPAAPPAAK